MKRLFARHRLDIGLDHLVFAACAMAAFDHDREARLTEAVWPEPGSALACYSVRSGFHLLLAALDLPAGSEVLFSAVTHPDMPRIAAHHGLVPVPVDLDPATLAPAPGTLERCVTSRSRVLVVAHLFGGHVHMGPLAAVCRRHGIVLVEDCAQSYSGPPESSPGIAPPARRARRLPTAWGGPTGATVSMFSFGILKTATALGGAMLTVHDPELRARMRALQAWWPVQTHAAHAKRIAQTAAFVALTRPRPYGLVARLAGVRFDRFVNSAARAFPAGSTSELIRRLERRPGAPLLRLMRHRIESFDRERLLDRAAAGELLALMLPPGMHVGGVAFAHTHWLFPVMSDDAEGVIASARANGFDAARSASSVNVVAAPADRPEIEPVNARRVMSKLVFLPAYPELPPGSLATLASAVRWACEQRLSQRRRDAGDERSGGRERDRAHSRAGA